MRAVLLQKGKEQWPCLCASAPIRYPNETKCGKQHGTLRRERLGLTLKGINMNARELGRFYTPAWAAQALVDRVPTTPRSVLDLCCGGGALAIAAAGRWSLEELVTVDIDPSIIAGDFALLASRVQHVQADALDISLPARLSARRFDLVLCNPPFGRKRGGTGNLVVAAANLAEASEWPAAETIGLAQALRMARPGGTVAAIMPDSFATGRMASRFRQSVAASHGLLYIAELPTRTFANTDAKAYLVVIKVGGSSDEIVLERLGQNGVEATETVDAKSCVMRMDLGSWHAKSLPQSSASLSSLGATVSRGRLSSAAARVGGAPSFHTSDFSTSEHGTVKLGGRSDMPAATSATVIARPGDILVARVDRRLEEKVAIVSEGSAEITDCVFRVRSSPADRERIWISLRSAEGRLRLASAARGVGPRHLALADLMAMQV
ncbi:MAG: hypothetical protein JWL66_890 [Sphingomonadales bacterium]|nr:hypothetical protein [Sphingomonadales bacterium]